MQITERKYIHEENPVEKKHRRGVLNEQTTLSCITIFLAHWVRAVSSQRKECED